MHKLLKPRVLIKPAKQIVFSGKQWQTIESGLKKLLSSGYFHPPLPTNDLSEYSQCITHVFTEIGTDNLIHTPF